MLSILIPVYNFPVEQLVNNLTEQIRADDIEAEIVIANDASSEFIVENKKLEKYDEVRYYELRKNRGRSFTRNFMAEKARYEFLLFIDCDVKVIDKNFLKTYYECIVNKNDVVCGGVDYPKKEEVKKAHYLRWYYGVKREKKPLYMRRNNPYRSFSSFNFMIQKDLFLSIKFPEQINTYGHEDTFFGLALKESVADVVHINNPLLHLGLEDAHTFIEKTKISVRNIDKLTNLVSNKNILREELKIFKYIHWAKKMHIQRIIKALYYITNQAIKKNLTSANPSLKLFDFYKLGYYFYSKK